LVDFFSKLNAPAGDQLDDQHDDGGQEDQVNEIPDGVDVDESQEGENQKHDKDGPEHIFSFELVYFASFAERQLRLKIFENPSASLSGRLVC
jgi:hypothetical protein